MLHIEIDGKKLEVEEGTMVIEVADAAGIYIPRFCYHKKLSVAANCRMCLVDVEKSAKPLPACATPVTEGMKIATRSAKAVDAQKGVMEFLLINHPLDCPICDQGGECDLQDLAVGFGKDASRYQEKKRIVKDKDIGPLIATDMTRCIHCTRCVRFGEELAGIMELGVTGRGEHLRIGTYVESTVDSELSGNMIDLCPVGALTSKPFRYRCRGWELISKPAASPHDCVGANIHVEVLRNTVMRVLPRENEAINESWLADRDRFSYEAVNSADRLTVPLIKENGAWRETDWNSALEFTVSGLRAVVRQHGAHTLGALAGAHSTLEEFYLLQKLVRALGSDNVDHRLRQYDFSDDDRLPTFPWLGQAITDLEQLDSVLLIGSNIRKEQPLLGLRLRKAFLRGAQVMAVNPLDYEFTFDLSAKVIAAPDGLAPALARITKALCKASQQALPVGVEAWCAHGEAGAAEQTIAETLLRGVHVSVLVGGLAQSHPQAAVLRALAETIAKLSGAKLGVLTEANSTGAWLAGCVPQRGAGGEHVAQPGRNAHAMLAEPLKGYIVMNAEPELDCWDGAAARRALAQAPFVVALSSFRGAAADAYAQVQLPLAAFTETAGTFVNCEGRWQSFEPAVPPPGAARPGWKILRVLGNLLGLGGFDYTSADEVRAAVPATRTPSSTLTRWQLAAPGILPFATLVRPGTPAAPVKPEAMLQRIAERPMYTVDPLVRRAPALLKTKDNPGPATRMNAAQAEKLKLVAPARVTVRAAGGEARLDLVIDARVPDGCVLIPAGYAETVALGGYGAVTVEGAGA
jgi:NADH-quinone oxidoreductase subunit G